MQNDEVGLRKMGTKPASNSTRRGQPYAEIR